MTMHSSSRNGAKVIWLGVHTTEGMMRAQTLRDWTGWAGSSHAANDETGVLMTPRDGFVPYDRAAWTLRNGNPISENIEQCGWARWTRAEWLAHPKLIDTTALWLADRSRARGIPLVRLSDADIRARKPGVLGHGDYSRATGDGTHWDPGPNYPWDVVLAKAKWLLNPTPPPVEDDMPYTPAQIAQHASDGVANRVITENAGQPVHTWEILRDLYHGQKAENAALAALAKLVADQNGLTVEDVRRVVSEEIAKGVDVDVTVAPGT